MIQCSPSRTLKYGIHFSQFPATTFTAIDHDGPRAKVVKVSYATVLDTLADDALAYAQRPGIVPTVMGLRSYVIGASKARGWAVPIVHCELVAKKVFEIV